MRVTAEPGHYQHALSSEKSPYHLNGYTNHTPTPSPLPKDQPPRPNGYPNHDSNSSHTPEDRPTSSSVGDGFFEQAKDWFIEGRYFKIQPGVANEDSSGLQGEEFILLDWKNDEGTAVRVDTIENRRWSSGNSRNMIAVFPPGPESNPHYPAIFVEEVGQWHSPGAIINRYARVNVTKIAAFDRYHCKDLGILREDSLEQIREKWLRLWAKQWRLSI